MTITCEEIWRAYAARFTTTRRTDDGDIETVIPVCICNRHETEAIWRESVVRNIGQSTLTILNTALTLMRDRIGTQGPKHPCAFHSLPT